MSKYDLALDLGYVFERLEPHQMELGYAINWIKSQLARLDAIRLAPAPDLIRWVITNCLTIGGPLHNHHHIAELIHENEEFLACAWASSACVAKKRMVLGQCEKVMLNQGGWKKARQEQQTFCHVSLTYLDG